MKKDQREIHRKLRILRYAEKIRSCREDLPPFWDWSRQLLPLAQGLRSSYPQMERQQDTTVVRGKDPLSSS